MPSKPAFVPEGPTDRLRTAIQVALAGMFAVLVLLLAIGLWWRYEDALRTGQRRAENLSLILSDHLQRTVAAIDTTLRQLAIHSERVGGPKAPAEAWRPVLDAALVELAGIGSLSVVDDAGIIAHSTIPEIVGQSRRDLYIYRRLSEEPQSGIVADTPFRGLRTGQLLMPLGRRLQDSSRGFAGAVVATFDPERLRGFYRSVDVGAHGIIWVLHTAGVIMFREPSGANPMGESAQDNPILRQHRRDGTGFLRAALAPGGPAYLTGYRAIADPSLVFAVSLAEPAVLTEWRRELYVATAIIALAGILGLLAGHRISQEIQARAEADSLLHEQAATLEAAVTEREMANVALRASQARFQAIMDHMPMTVAVKDQDGRYVFVNRAFERRAGLPAAQALGKTVCDLFPKKLADLNVAHDHDVRASGTAIQREIHLADPSKPRVFLVVKFPLPDEGAGTLGLGSISTDITDRKEAEAQLAHAQKMEAVGQLTGGIAHDFNNLLTAILLNAEMLLEKLPPTNRLRYLAEVTLEAAERGADLTRRLLAFGRRQLLEPRPTDINSLIEGMNSLMRRTLGEHIRIDLDLNPNLWPATVDPGQLEMAVLNLAVNARDAMPDGGRLTIETRNIELDETYAELAGDMSAGDYVMILVGDTGSGMPPEVAARAFDPFFTTKDIGKGTGLGLSTVYGFVKQSGGHARIYSEVGIGTVVKLYLPRALMSATGTDAAAATGAELPTGTELILLVEDDPLVRNHTEGQLRSLGYRVISAQDAHDALQKVDGGVGPDLLFTDVVMPGGMNGRQLAERLRTALPKLKVLYTSGYAHGALNAHNGNSIGSSHILAKPFRRRELAAKVREVLDSADL